MASRNGHENGNSQARPPVRRRKARGAGTGAEKGRAVRVSGLELFVRERGEGHPLLMINGLGGNLEMWGPAERILSAGSHLIMFDGPGMGRSQTPLFPMPIPAIARAVRDLLDQLGHEQVDVLGYSMGGVIAQQLARDEPDRIRRLALVSTACGWGSVPGQLPALSVIAMPLRYYSRRLYEHTNRLLGEFERPDASMNAQEDARLRYPPSLLGYAYLVCAGAMWSSLPWLSSVGVPTLVLSGATDRLVPPANSVQLAGLLPESRLHLVPDEGHLLLFGESPSHALLADYFTSETLEASSAWTSGTVVDADQMRVALRETTGGQPVRAFSDTFRWLVDVIDAGRVLR